MPDNRRHNTARSAENPYHSPESQDEPRAPDGSLLNLLELLERGATVVWLLVSRSFLFIWFQFVCIAWLDYYIELDAPTGPFSSRAMNAAFVIMAIVSLVFAVYLLRRRRSKPEPTRRIEQFVLLAAILLTLPAMIMALDRRSDPDTPPIPVPEVIESR